MTMNVHKCGCCAVALLLAGSLSAQDKIVWKETFDNPSALTNWCCDSCFSIRMGEGENGSGALVWEASKKRPAPPPDPKPVAQEEDNVVRILPPSTRKVGREVCRRRIPLEPGRRYNVSVRLKGAITNNCGYLFLALYDRDGKPMGRPSYAKPTIWKDVGTNGWQTLSVATLRLPQAASYAETYLEFYNTTLGRMCFDDYTVTCDGIRLMELMFSSAYRDEQAEGKVRFVAPYVLANGMDAKHVSGRFMFKGREGDFQLAADIVDGCRFEASLDVGRLAIGKSEVRAEFLYDGEVRDFCTLQFDHPEKLSTRRVRIDERNMTYVDGKPFFPIGVYVHHRDKRVPCLDRLQGGPFNCVIECTPRVSTLNRIQKAGLMAIPKSPRSAVAMRAAYESLRNHPALLAWYVIDEAFPGRALIEVPLQKLRRELDPDHPTIAVLNIAENTGPLMGCFDIIARDPYPLSVNCKFPPGCDRRDLLDVAFWPELMRRYGYGLPPAWQVPQAFSWGWLRNWGTPELDRFPTEDELRSMAWQSIAGGANGILWYSASMIFGRAAKDKAESEACWNILVRIAAEINRKMPYLISEERAPAVVGCPDDAAARTFMKDGKVATLVTNRASKPVSGEVRLNDGTVLKVDLAPYGVAWIEQSSGAAASAGGVSCVSDAARLSVVQMPPEYNSWPMIRAVGDRIVCTYGRGSGHTIEGARGAYARTSSDGGQTWSSEVCIVNDPVVCEGVEGIGNDSSGAVLCWMNCRARGHIRHELYRTVDGVAYERIAAPALSPEPIQITGIFSVPDVGLMSLWFAGNYKGKEPCNSWGTLVSGDGGRTWVQRTVESGLAKDEWPTEIGAVHIGGGRILAIGRCEGGAKRQYQITSTDGGATWRKVGTNIRDVRESTPSLVFDPKTGLVANYYYHRGAKLLKRRVVDAEFIFRRPESWPEPEVLAAGSERRFYDAGNVNAMECLGRHWATFYSGTDSDSGVFVVSTPMPKPAESIRRAYVLDFEVASQSATCGVVNVSAPGLALFNAQIPPVGGKTRTTRAFASMKPVDAKSLQTGKWRVSGEYSINQLAFEEVTPVYDVVDGVELGDKETLFGRTYRSITKFGERYGSVHRSLVGYSGCYLHDTHWRFGKGGSITFRHNFGGRRMEKAKLSISASNISAPFAVEASVDGSRWKTVATFGKEDKKQSVGLPSGAEIKVRLVAGDSGFYLWGCSFEATIDGEPGYRVGRTNLRKKDGTSFRWPDSPEKPYAAGALLASTDDAMRLWTAAAGWKVFPENPLPADKTGAVGIKTAANETECAQLVVTPKTALDGVQVRVADVPACGSKSLPTSAVEVLKVSCVNVRIPTDSTCATGLWPDPIERQSEAGCSVAADESQSFWVRVKPPKGTPPGVYRGTLELLAKGHAPQRVPLEVEVFGFEMPDTMTCETAFGCRIYNLIRQCHLTTPSDKRRMYDVYFRMLAEHHITVYDPDPTTPLTVKWKGLENPATAEPVFNWDEWDAAIGRSFREYHSNTLRMPIKGLGGGTYERRFDPEIAGFKEGTPEYDILMGKYLRAVEGHLREKGWLDKAYVYWFDEPDAKDYAFCTNGFAKLKRHAPGIRRMITEEADRTLLDSVNLWCPVTPNFHKGEIAAARAKGDQFWWYVCCAPKAPYATEFIDKPGTEMRVWLWQTWKENVTGILIWDTIYWSGGSTYRGVAQDCWDDTQCWCDSARLQYPYSWGNGDGRFLYPPHAARDRKRKDPVLDPPVETYRLEMLRDGLEDYEYFAILRRLDPENPLLNVPRDVTASMTEFARDPAPMMRHRELLARAIESRLSKP